MSCCGKCGGRTKLAGVDGEAIEKANGNDKPGLFGGLAKAIAGASESVAACIVCGAAPLAFGTAGAVIAAALPSGKVSRGTRAVYAAIGTVGGVAFGLGAIALWRNITADDPS